MTPVGLGAARALSVATAPTVGRGLRPRRPELLVVDSRVAGSEVLLAGLRPGVDVLRLHPAEDGLRRIGDVVSERGPYSAIHVLAHGVPGSMLLGRVELTATLADRRREDLAAWFPSRPDRSTSTPDLLIYACHLAYGERGQRLVRKLADVTGADVAASTDSTGGIARGANWELEHRVGRVERGLPFSNEAARAYRFLLGVGGRWAQSEGGR